jgi:hypothetical protein
MKNEVEGRQNELQIEFAFPFSFVAFSFLAVRQIKEKQRDCWLVFWLECTECIFFSCAREDREEQVVYWK